MSEKIITWELCDPRRSDGEAGINEGHFRRLAQLICEEYQSDMLPKKPADLLLRFREHRLLGVRRCGPGLESDPELSASCNLDPLFDADMAKRIFGDWLAAEISVPKVVELGGVIVAPEYQGHGLGELMAYTMLREYEEDISSGRMLVVLTTKHAAMLMTVLPKIGIDLSEVKATISRLGFRAYRHDEPEVRMLGALTCTCESNLGMGYGYVDAVAVGCPKRTKRALGMEGLQETRVWLKEQFAENNGHVDCTMAVSSGNHAAYFSRGLEKALQRITDLDVFSYFVNQLRESDYYGKRFVERRISYAEERCC
jgi:GNAT superfamily N-acetyltransferase